MYQHTPIDQVDRLPKWRQPKTLLYLMAIAMPLTFAVWSALLNNFVVEVASFDGSDIGWLHTVREIPGFLAVGVIALIIFIREQVLGLVSLVLLGKFEMGAWMAPPEARRSPVASHIFPNPSDFRSWKQDMWP